MHREKIAGVVYTTEGAQGKGKTPGWNEGVEGHGDSASCNRQDGKSSRVESIGGYIWLIIDVILVVALAAAILWGIHVSRQRRRGRADDWRSDEAVKRVYCEEDSKS